MERPIEATDNTYPVYGFQILIIKNKSTGHNYTVYTNGVFLNSQLAIQTRESVFNNFERLWGNGTNTLGNHSLQI